MVVKLIKGVTTMLYYKGLIISYDESAKDYVIKISAEEELNEHFNSLSYVYNYIDMLLLGEL